LIDIISSLSQDERVLFVKFLTGARSLPATGFAGLKPQLTIVKAVTDGWPADEALPTVMTCANFVKLPEYSSKEVMKAQLLKAIHEGQGSFLLS
jgi:E3 ubiquitin-protein ligase TRIP12